MQNKREIRELAALIYARLPKLPITDATMPGVDMNVGLAIAHAERFYELLDKHMEESNERK